MTTPKSPSRKLPSERIDELFKELCEPYSGDYGYWIGSNEPKNPVKYMQAVVAYLDEQSNLKHEEGK